MLDSNPNNPEMAFPDDGGENQANLGNERPQCGQGPTGSGGVPGGKEEDRELVWKIRVWKITQLK